MPENIKKRFREWKNKPVYERSFLRSFLYEDEPALGVLAISVLLLALLTVYLIYLI